MSGVVTPLRVLLVEDSENDALLVLRELRRGGYEPLYERVDTPEGMERALEEAREGGKSWEVILSDYYMPRFMGPEALDLLRGLGYDTPFVVVSGKIGEDAAVAMMRAGAQDYVAKENLARLCPAIERELGEARARNERRRSEEALRFLAAAGAELSSSLDYRTALASAARLAVPHLADWCAVDVLEEDGSTRRLAVEHQDPAKVALALQLQERYPASARHVRVRLWSEGDLACVEVADDGRGFDTGDPGIGVGQHSMRHRALEIGGELKVESAPGRGTCVRFEAPVSRLVAGS